MSVDFGVVTEKAQHGQAGSYGKRVSRKCPPLVYGTHRSYAFHDVPATSECAHRYATADHFAQRSQVRGHAVKTLRSGKGHAESRHDLVENQDSTVLTAQFAHPLQESRIGRNAAHVASNRFDDDRRDPARVLCEDLLQRFEIVERKRQCGIGKGLRHASRIGNPQSRESRTSLDEQRIHVPVVVPYELDRQVAPRETARHPQRAHRRLRAGIHEPHHIDRGHDRGNDLGYLQFG